MRSTTRRMLFPVITIGWPEEKGPRSLSQLLSIGNVDDRRGRTCGSWSIFMPGSLFLVRKHELFIPLGTKMRNSNRAMHSWYPNSVLTSCQTVPWELVLWSGPKVQAYTVSLTLFSSPHHGQNSSPFLLLLPLLPWLLSGLSKCPWASFFYHCSHSDTPSAFPLQKIHESLYLNLSLKPLEEACSVFIVLINSLYCHMLWHPHWGLGTGARPLGQRVTPELQTQAPPHCIYVTWLSSLKLSFGEILLH